MELIDISTTRWSGRRSEEIKANALSISVYVDVEKGIRKKNLPWREGLWREEERIQEGKALVYTIGPGRLISRLWLFFFLERLEECLHLMGGTCEFR